MVNLWDQWKKGFDTWERKTAEVLESALKSTSVLQPVGSLLSAGMRLKASTDSAVATLWASVGLPTRRDQERTLHALNQLNSRLIDLEEKLADAHARQPR
jgi:Poly(R)-hydroxyalkanoic acid synthase subunit (PHA_synth_III_E)